MVHLQGQTHKMVSKEPFRAGCPVSLIHGGWLPGAVSAPVGPTAAAALRYPHGLGPTVLLPPGRASSSRRAAERLPEPSWSRGTTPPGKGRRQNGERASAGTSLGLSFV